MRRSLWGAGMRPADSVPSTSLSDMLICTKLQILCDLRSEAKSPQSPARTRATQRYNNNHMRALPCNYDLTQGIRFARFVTEPEPEPTPMDLEEATPRRSERKRTASLKQKENDQHRGPFSNCKYRDVERTIMRKEWRIFQRPRAPRSTTRTTRAAPGSGPTPAAP